MKNIYFLLTFIAFLSCSIQNGYSQTSVDVFSSSSIKGLSVYPNPINNSASTVFITSDNSNTTKRITIYNVLGKQIKAPVITRKALDISALNSGVYILKITENNIIETRKLVIK